MIYSCWWSVEFLKLHSALHNKEGNSEKFSSWQKRCILSLFDLKDHKSIQKILTKYKIYIKNRDAQNLSFPSRLHASLFRKQAMSLYIKQKKPNQTTKKRKLFNKAGFQSSSLQHLIVFKTYCKTNHHLYILFILISKNRATYLP